MKRKSPFYVAMLIIGICCIAASLFFRAAEVKTIAGILIGIGGSLFGISLCGLYTNRIERKNPEVEKQTEIEFKDERNTMIRNRAKAEAGDITQWLVMVIAYITIFISAPLWVTSAVVAVFLLYNAIGIYLMNKYQKEM
jgi:hypothetical protein